MSDEDRREADIAWRAKIMGSTAISQVESVRGTVSRGCARVDLAGRGIA